MVEDDRWCPDIVGQIAAIQASLDNVALSLVEEHVRNCMIGRPGQAQSARTTELMQALGRLVRR